MGKSRFAAPSPIRSALIHSGLSLVSFTALAGGVAGIAHLTGDARDAGPRYVVALFDPVDTAAPDLRARLAPGEIAALAPLGTGLVADAEEPSLGVADPGGPAAQPAAADVVTINGREVKAGESLAEVEARTALARAPIDGLVERSRLGPLPKIADDGRTPATAYARPFENPTGKPTVAVIVGGLGLNWTHTNSAIDELPPEVTLSFVPYARGSLQRWIDKARAAGHEVLIELPMEPYETGRTRPHSHTLGADRPANDNLGRLQWLLSRATGYFGVSNYQGAKFATADAAVRPVMADLSARGVAFVEDGSLPRSVINTVAADEGVRYARAARVIDTRDDADAIEAQLSALESLAISDGQALGSGFAFPVTIDVVKTWTERLEDKGIRLAPASNMISAPKPADAVRPAEDPAG